MPRKELTYDDRYLGLPILPEPEHGNYLPILDAIHVRMQDMLDRHCRVFGALLGLNLPWDSGRVPHNRHVQAFFDAYSRYLKGRGIDYHYVWVREQPAADAQPHFHCLVLFDGNKTWSFYPGHLDTASRLWASALGVERGDGLVHLCTWHEAMDPDIPYVGNGGVMMLRNSPDCDQAYQLLSHRASYISKFITKEFTPPNLRKFSASHLT